jgi:membrane dipeptidase
MNSKEDIPIVDLHSDTFYKHLFLKDYEEAKYLYIKNNENYINIYDNFHVTKEKIIKGNIRVNVQSLYVSNKNIEAPLKNSLMQLFLIKNFIKENSEFYQIYSIDDIKENIDKKYGILVSIEGLEVIEGNIELLDIFYELGVKIIAPTWNRITQFMGNVIESYGLFKKGLDLIKKLNQLKVIIDVSHMGEKEFFDIVELASAPIIATHSNVYEINNHKRNLKDEQINEINNLKGLIGINLSPSFLKPTNDKYNISLRKNEKYPISYYWIYNMIDYISSKYSEDIISFGADFDGIFELPEGIYGIDFYRDFIDFLFYKGLKKETIEKICYKNFLRVFSLI